ncbi:DUF305 domain-containing protein [Aeromicrobium fastidiosum]|uniref:DUF305 domain-containing protein n=1 Tax=Aeromicrobium fastidiosum TaxID=52699 RepID=UPI00202366EF|nr:DUF305 domain-containing protein [Aeromicrobium fastidiosum]MCL8251683.1 DUF305 domain-containing protein [Aeromicrobium fastidiosum]
MNRLIALLAALPLVLVAACGSSDESDAGHGDADVAFVQQMVPHHEQAVEMADMAERADASADVKALAAQIEAAQGPEIATMKTWLDDWDVPSDHAGHDMGDGMMSDSDMTGLAQLSGAAFDQEWLTLMIEHHEGAVAMARTELADGRDARAQKLARQVIADQQREIATMKGLLG